MKSDIVAAARSCLKTPFEHQGRHPKIGLDCIGLCVFAASSTGHVAHDSTAYGRNPSPKKFLSKLAESVDFVPFEQAEDGDGVVMHFAGREYPQHVGILATGKDGRRVVIHTWSEVGQVTETPIDDEIREKILKAFVFRRAVQC
jgi:cell wall-associated NlpC family hydrolase